MNILVVGLTGESIMLKVADFAKVGETNFISDVHFEPGGKGFNQALAIASLGAKVKLCSSVGQDEYSKICYKTLIDLGVEPLFKYKEDAKTALATVFTNTKGDNLVNVYKGAAELLSEDDINLLESEIKVASLILMQLEQSLVTTKSVMALAKKHNVKVIINPAPAVNYDYCLLKDAYVITPNEIEAKEIFGFEITDSDLELSKKISAIELTKVIITLGAKGFILYDEGEVVRIPCFEVKVVDTVGAGDGFNGALVYALSENYPLLEAACFANIFAGLSVRKAHVIGSYPNLKEVGEYFKKQYN